MYGAIIGDIVGSVYEFHNLKSKDFHPFFHEKARFTDDTVMTVAMMDSLLNGIPYGESMVKWYNKHPRAGYGGNFRAWCVNPSRKPYYSWGNGSAMRTSPVGWWFNSFKKTMDKAEEFAAVTHNHPEGIKGAQAVAASIFTLRHGGNLSDIYNLGAGFGYNLDKSLDEIRPSYRFDVSCQGSVPVAIKAFLEGKDFEDVIRNAVSVGGDSDTIAAIAGSIAEACYPIPEGFVEKANAILPQEMVDIVSRFRDTVSKEDFD